MVENPLLDADQLQDEQEQFPGELVDMFIAKSKSQFYDGEELVYRVRRLDKERVNERGEELPYSKRVRLKSSSGGRPGPRSTYGVVTKRFNECGVIFGRLQYEPGERDGQQVTVVKGVAGKKFIWERARIKYPGGRESKFPEMYPVTPLMDTYEFTGERERIVVNTQTDSGPVQTADPGGGNGTGGLGSSIADAANLLYAAMKEHGQPAGIVELVNMAVKTKDNTLLNDISRKELRTIEVLKADGKVREEDGKYVAV